MGRMRRAAGINVNDDVATSSSSPWNRPATSLPKREVAELRAVLLTAPNFFCDAGRALHLARAVVLVLLRCARTLRRAGLRRSLEDRRRGREDAKLRRAPPNGVGRGRKPVSIQKTDARPSDVLGRASCEAATCPARSAEGRRQSLHALARRRWQAAQGVEEVRARHARPDVRPALRLPLNQRELLTLPGRRGAARGPAERPASLPS